MERPRSVWGESAGTPSLMTDDMAGAGCSICEVLRQAHFTFHTRRQRTRDVGCSHASHDSAARPC
jgi:hypothetical protein